MINDEIKQAVTGYFQELQREVVIILQTGEHPKRGELAEFLASISDLSAMVHFEESDLNDQLRSPISFALKVDGEFSGIIFSGIPGGHEFNSLILAILQCGGADLKLDNSIQSLISKIDEQLTFEIFVSLSCQNCPDVVQAFNKFSLINKKISAEMIDGGLFQEIIDSRNIQGVPSIFLNGELFLNGRVDVTRIIEELQNRYPYLKSAPSMNSVIQDVAIIGGGPAGISAAIYSARKGLKVSLVAEKIGGQVSETLGIENMISVSSTTGGELTNAMRSHLNDYEVSVKEYQTVTDISTDTCNVITLNSGEQLKSKTVIVCTGADWRKLGIPGEEENIGTGVAYCPHCEGPFFKGEDVVVVGGGNSGIEAALDLSTIVKSITVLEFLPDLKADEVLVKQARSRDNINIICNAECKTISSIEGKVTSITFVDKEAAEETILETKAVFVQIGLIPNSQFLSNFLELNTFGEIIVNNKCETSRDSVFACGDVTNVPYKQISISMGEGAKASLAASDYLMKQPAIS